MLITEKAAVVLLLIVVSPFANARIVMESEIACPIGGERFKTTIALSGTQFGQNLDRRPFGAIAAPWPLAKCPNGFVIYKEKFADSELKRLKSYVLSKDYQALKTSETNYYLAARLMRQLDVPIEALADALLKATWEAEQDSRYRRYATEALSAFEAVIASPPPRIYCGRDLVLPANRGGARAQTRPF